LGKTILAFLPEDEINSIVEKYPLIKMTPKTITQRAHFIEHLASVREQGVALDLEENLSGAVCVAGPIFDQHGRVVAGLSVSGPAGRIEAKLSRLQDEVRTACATISRVLNPHGTSTRDSQTAQSAPASESQTTGKRKTYGASWI
jgi:DNA-binding IclR family transcriptional regulator